MKLKKLVFLTSDRVYVDMLWNRDAAERAKRYGFQLQIPEPGNPNYPGLDRDCTALITTWGSPHCTAELLDRMPNVKIIGHAAGSVKAVIEPEVYRRGIAVTSANLVMSEAVAEWSLLMTLLATRKFFIASSYPGRRAMDWQRNYEMADIKKLTIGCWGYGDITKHLIRMLKPLNPGQILVASNYADPAMLTAAGVKPVTLEQLLAESDIIHCLAGINQTNYHRLGCRELALIKNGAVLVNAGRARLIQEQALLTELKSGRFSAFLDVHYQEPVPVDSPFYQLDNVVMTPHNAGYPGREFFIPFLLDEFNRFFHGAPLASGVSAERFSSMTDEKLAFAH